MENKAYSEGTRLLSVGQKWMQGVSWGTERLYCTSTDIGG